MEEDIKLLEKLEFIAYGKKEDIEALKIELGKDIEKIDTTKIIRNLINKYKEQKRDIRASHILLAKYSQKIEEQQKIIELMAKDIAENKLNEDICRQVKEPKKEECYAYIHDENACSDCVIEYYEKKAREKDAELV